jgi:hypothetical protein
MAVIKIIGILLGILLFFGLFVFGPFYDRLSIQIAVFLGVIAWNSYRSSLRETIALLKFCLPFVFTLFSFGLLFHFVQLFGRQDWLQDSLIKCLIFPSSLIFLRLLLTYITYLDILALPISMNRRVDLITMRSAFQKGGTILRRFSWYLANSYQLQTGSRLSRAMRRYACLIIALYLYLYEEIEDSHRLLMNRYQHLYEAKQ